MIRIRQIKIKLGEEDSLKKVISKKLKISERDILDIVIQKKSLDARCKDDIHYVYEVDVKIPFQDKVLKRCKSKDIFTSPKEEYQRPVAGNLVLNNRPIIVGSGTAGLF